MNDRHIKIINHLGNTSQVTENLVKACQAIVVNLTDRSKPVMSDSQ